MWVMGCLVEGLKQRVKRCKDHRTQRQLEQERDKLMQQEPIAPAHRRLSLNDVNVEGLQDALRDNTSIELIYDESGAMTAIPGEL
jgi:hypothetical protein